MVTPDAQRAPISFPQWSQRLAAAHLSDAQQAAFRREILAFLHHCKLARAPASIALARQFLDERGASAAGVAREALRWARPRGS